MGKRGYEIERPKWTDDKIEALRKHWAAGESCTDIGKRLGFSRNAVIGKVNRLGLERREKPSRPVPVRIKTKQPPKPRRVKEDASPDPAPLPPPPSSGSAPDDTTAAVLALTSTTCKWPIGDPKQPGFRFCMREKPADQPYCSGAGHKPYQPNTRARLRDVCGG